MRLKDKVAIVTGGDRGIGRGIGGRRDEPRFFLVVEHLLAVGRDVEGVDGREEVEEGAGQPVAGEGLHGRPVGLGGVEAPGGGAGKETAGGGVSLKDGKDVRDANARMT